MFSAGYGWLIAEQAAARAGVLLSDLCMIGDQLDQEILERWQNALAAVQRFHGLTES